MNTRSLAVGKRATTRKREVKAELKDCKEIKMTLIQAQSQVNKMFLPPQKK